MSSDKITCFSITFFLFVLCQLYKSEGQLQVGFYSSSCSMAEFIVKDEVRKAISVNRGAAAGLVRMLFHDCFVRGCDASILLDSTSGKTAEKDWKFNKLGVFQVIDNAKARLEDVCKGIVSCADIISFAARDSVEMTGGFGYHVPAGRRDGTISLASEVSSNLVPPTFNVDQLTQSFVKKGLNQEDMVILSGKNFLIILLTSVNVLSMGKTRIFFISYPFWSDTGYFIGLVLLLCIRLAILHHAGGHTLGQSHCTAFSNRLYNFSTTSSQDPSLDPLYAARLKEQCPQGSTNANLVVPMDPGSPFTTDNGYYVNIIENRGLFTSDQILLTNPVTASLVNQFARNPVLWKSKFAAAMVKMGQIGILTGKNGEIRKNCQKINS